jgi:hypothetical protein
VSQNSYHRKLRPLVGLRFGRLVVLGDAGWSDPAPSGKCRRLVRCLCDCGNEAVVMYASLQQGMRGKRLGTKSCGCLLRENAKKQGQASRGRGHGEAHPTTPEFRSYTSMLTRCYNSRVAEYPRYGGRGIQVCERWRTSYLGFLADMGRRPSAQHSLDRIDNDGNYEPENCRWATSEQQNRNRGKFNHHLTWLGKKQTIAAWSEELGIPYQQIWRRVRRGHSTAEILGKEQAR